MIRHIFTTCLATISVISIATAEELKVLPEAVELRGPESFQQLLLQKDTGFELSSQLTEGVTWNVENPEVVKVTASGKLRPVANGETKVSATIDDKTITSTVTVADMEKSFQWSFRHDVLPVLSKAGCNSGACHGALAGKGGFRLSLRGYDPPTDFFNTVKQDRGRRVEFADPGRSLILAKPSGGIRHKGGLRFGTDSEEYRILAEWISAGAVGPKEDEAAVEHLEVLPGRSIHEVGETQQMIVQAHFSDGRTADVTPWVIWSSSNEAVCSVDEKGMVNVMSPGEGAVVAWYSSKIAIARITVPFPTVSGPDADVLVDTRPPANFIDEHIDQQLIRLNLPASPGCSDSTFVRRAYLDTIGRLPSPNEVRDFLTSSAEDKRNQLIEQLLNSSDFVDYWTYQWSDVLMLNGALLRPKALKAYYDWLHKHVESNSPWDVMIREILTATGDSYENGATNFYALYQSPEDMTENACQAFMGLSIGCARCHNHPLEKWTNDQYYGMANLFARVKAKGWGGQGASGDGLRTLYVAEEGDLVQPRTGFPQAPTPLDGDSLALNDTSDRRLPLAEWMTSPENPYFAKSITNRIWARYFGVGLVESVDDMRVSNPASNEELLQAASDYLVEQKFDLKSLMRMILLSNAYQRTSDPLPGNKEEKRFYSRYYPRRLMAEVLHDCVVQVTEVPSKFDHIEIAGANRQKTDFYPLGTKAVQLYDAAVENYFLSTFGRNPRNIVCECERSAEPSTVQVLHISNGSTINHKLKDEKSCISSFLKLRADGMSDYAILDEIYLDCLARYPNARERQNILSVLPPPGDKEEREVVEDIYWAIFSSREFLFNH
ncbi:DUF1549 domain-containing protein [Calycomorphotria hydatis]|uniref:Bacterial Ig-like domain (Group 2) n=1 Tax=Calycomorphotria hydatis TaxID=2528027 RepID=A0A517TB60_9PLAN|nr:DUF1549 domain-containing protein [Calycomorphotria hydatis]QDT65605.1 Bacterial Ig-like domain (group 2) [Calycomorphotria hydatis]